MVFDKGEIDKETNHGTNANVSPGSGEKFGSINNSSGPRSWASRFITPDGLIGASLPVDEPGVMLNLVDTTRKYYDASAPYRLDAINGKLNSGQIVDDPRSNDRTGY